MVTYCVVLSDARFSRVEQCFVGAYTAALALQAAQKKHPHHRPLGVEPLAQA
jgi:hypothetical protein